MRRFMMKGSQGGKSSEKATKKKRKGKKSHAKADLIQSQPVSTPKPPDDLRNNESKSIPNVVNSTVLGSFEIPDVNVTTSPNDTYAMASQIYDEVPREDLCEETSSHSWDEEDIYETADPPGHHRSIDDHNVYSHLSASSAVSVSNYDSLQHDPKILAKEVIYDSYPQLEDPVAKVENFEDENYDCYEAVSFERNSCNDFPGESGDVIVLSEKLSRMNSDEKTSPKGNSFSKTDVSKHASVLDETDLQDVIGIEELHNRHDNDRMEAMKPLKKFTENKSPFTVHEKDLNAPVSSKTMTTLSENVAVAHGYGKSAIKGIVLLPTPSNDDKRVPQRKSPTKISEEGVVPLPREFDKPMLFSQLNCDATKESQNSTVVQARSVFANSGASSPATPMPYSKHKLRVEGSSRREAGRVTKPRTCSSRPTVEEKHGINARVSSYNAYPKENSLINLRKTKPVIPKKFRRQPTNTAQSELAMSPLFRSMQQKLNSLGQ